MAENTETKSSENGTAEPSLEVSVPTILRDCTGGRSAVTVHAATLDQALERLKEAYPLLRIHLFEESGQLRPHVMLFYNEESTRWLPSMEVPLHAGDKLDILQAVSGG